MISSAITNYGESYCVIDMHNLFVGTTLADEILILGGRASVLTEVSAACVRFGIGVQSHRLLSSYSGGEQALICCLLLMRLLPDKAVPILLVHVLETLSPGNRQRLLHEFRATAPQATLHTMGPQGPCPIDHA